MMDLRAQFAPLERWLETLQARERNLVYAGAIFLIISILYLAVWDPVFSALDAAKQENQSQRELLSWMKSASIEARALQSSGASLADRFKNQSLSSLAERSALSSGTKAFIRKLESDKEGVKVQLEQADFDRVIFWLHDMQSKYDIFASSILVEPHKETGAVNVRLTLERTES
ncbi:MAG: type II secretion system protein M [Gammaproteobacteria bacterium]|nr:MAG: type II secretion system protein M [Gammaproteobacteria bacterium]